MAEHSGPISIRNLTFEEFKVDEPRLSGWIYPRRDISAFIPLFSTAQRAALNFYGWIALLMLSAGFMLPFALLNWWWVLLIPGGVIMWKANRKSMEQFFLENLQTDVRFYDAIRKTEMGESVKAVFR